MPAIFVTVRDIPLGELARFPGNARRGDVGAIRASLRRHGQYRSLVVRDTGSALVVLAGNHTRDALDAEGLASARCEVITCTDDEARRINLADNRLAELGGYDDADLAALLEGLDGDFDGTGWAQDDLDALLAEEPEGRTDPDDAPDVPGEPVTKPGDLWQLGPHRLLCGDAADITAHDRLLAGGRPSLLLMDPPYGMRLDTDFSTIKGSLRAGKTTRGPAPTQGNKYEHVIGDHDDYDPQQVLGLYNDVAEQFWWGADYYAERIPGRTDGSWLVWDKRKESQAEAIGSEFELAWSRGKHKRRMLRHEWFGFLSSESAAEARNRIHPTQKPVALYADILTQWGKPGGLVLDAYAGSGTTVIACHQAGMTAAVMELSPAYCDVIVQRYRDHTGTEPELLEAAHADAG